MGCIGAAWMTSYLLHFTDSGARNAIASLLQLSVSLEYIVLQS